MCSFIILIPLSSSTIKSQYELLNIADDFKISAILSAYYIGNTSDRTLKRDYNNFLFSRLEEFKFINVVSQLDSIFRQQPRPINNNVDSFSNTRDVKSLNEVNYGIWLENQVKLLLYGTESPIPINLPTKKTPYYSLQDGTPLAGFIINAFATGHTIPALRTPPLLQENPNNKNNPLFMNYRNKTKHRVSTMSNINVYNN